MLIRYVAMRLVQLVPMALVVTMVVFFVMRIIPGDPVLVMLGAVEGAPISQEVYDAMRLRLGLDQPLIVQYLDWLWDMLQGELGDSTTYRTPALAVILHRLVPTAYLMVGGVVMAVAIAVPGGVLAAIHNNTKWDHLATGFVILGITVPTFWLALVAILIFAVYLGWLPSIGYIPPQKDFLDFLRPKRASGFRSRTSAAPSSSRRPSTVSCTFPSTAAEAWASRWWPTCNTSAAPKARWASATSPTTARRSSRNG